MLQFLDYTLTQAGVTYWVTGGTLLGAMRHGGFVPHDDDVDVELLEDELPRAVEALGAVGRAWRGLGEWPGSNVPMGRFFFWGSDCRFTESVDVFLRARPLAELAEFPSEAEAFPLRRVPFEGIQVWAPRDAEGFLARLYGPSWCEEAVVWSHSAGGRQLLRAPLADYLESVAALVAAGAASAAPCAATLRASPEESLAAVGLGCPGEFRQMLWETYGWASPWPPDFDEMAALLDHLERE